MPPADEESEYPLNAAGTVPPAEVAAAWQRELAGVPTSSIEVITPLWRVAKWLADDRRRTLAQMSVEPATLDLLSTLRRAGAPYELTTRQLTQRTMVTAGAVSQRVARAEREGWVSRSRSSVSRRAVTVTLTATGHDLIETTVRTLLTHEETLVAGLTDRERRTLARLLAKIGPG